MQGLMLPAAVTLAALVPDEPGEDMTTARTAACTVLALVMCAGWAELTRED